MIKKLIWLLCCLLYSYYITAQDSTYQGKAGLADVADSDPGLFMVMMIVLALFVASCILVSILMIAAALILVLFTAVGIVSASFIAGLHQRSVKTAFKWLYSLSAGIIGSICGVPAVLIIKALFHLTNSYTLLIPAGITIGFVGGLICGRLIFYFTIKILGYAKNKVLLTGK